MKIKTITCHNVYNYGASLQAYALMHYLENTGHDVEIIDYLPDYKKVYNFTKVPQKGKMAKMIRIMPFLKRLLALIHNRKTIRLLPKKKYFDSFTRNYLHLTSRQYNDYRDLEKNPPYADLFIAGSDQIWNTAHGNGIDPAFYCLFEKIKDKCITYSASFGISQIPSEHEDFVRQSLRHFRAISVREKTGADIIARYGIESQIVVDPVFLLRKKEWMDLCKKDLSGDRYLLLYDFKLNDPEVEKVARKVAEERCLKIYSIYSTPKYADRFLKKVGPIEFLELVKGADFVVSTSFHATAFSVLFEKDFYTFAQKGEENSSRMSDFLSSIGLESRFLMNSDNIVPSQPVDYKLVRNKLEISVEYSKKWLLNNLYNAE